MEINALAHITGGGITENLPRVLPANAQARIDLTSWARPEIFNWIQTQGNITDQDMYRTFNCGVGMIVCVAQQHAQQALENLNADAENAFIIGTIAEKPDDEAAVILS